MFTHSCGKNAISNGCENFITPPPTLPGMITSQAGGPAGIDGRRRPAIPYQAYYLTQTITLNP
ncbi:MAG: hypothetical protein FIA98_15280 [Anaerolineae bacterium]|nr:hypothetical protein [Anaerolineae bacterium]